MSSTDRQPVSEPDRLTRLEVVVEALAADVSSLAKTVRDRSGINWNAVGFVVTLLGAFYWNLAVQVDANRDTIKMNAETARAYADQRFRDNRELLNETRERLDRRVEKEEERNNRYGEMLGGILKVNQLFEAGKLNLNGSVK